MLKRIVNNYKLFLLVLALVLAAALCACSGGIAKIEKSGYPNKPAENAKISEKYNAVSQEISKDAIEEYMNFINIPHPSKGEDKLRAYLVN